MSTYSSSLRIELITTGDQAGTWGNTTNTNLGTLMEAGITGYTSVAVASANQAFTANNGAADEARNMTIALTTSTGANFAVYAPPAEKTYVIYNASAYTATLYNSTVLGNTTAAGTGVAIAAGKTMTVWSDGTNFAFQNTLLVGNVVGDVVGNVTGNVTGNLNGNLTAASPTAATQAPGTNNTTIATTAFVAAATGGLGTMSTQNANNVAITGGSITGATLNASDLASGTAPVARLAATGTPSASTYLRGDSSWASLPTALSGPQGQVFTSSGTFTVPTGITSVKVTVIGGGGGGGSARVPTCGGSTGGSGGGGGASIKYVTGLTSGGTVSVTVGSGGTGGVPNGAGGTGGTSSFGAYCSATGGGGGAHGFNAQGASGSNGAGSSGDINLSGFRVSIGGGVVGYAPIYGGIVVGSVSDSNGLAGINLGSGGTGGDSTSAARSGGAGSAGIVIVEF